MKKRKMKHFYIAAEAADKYEFPVAMADSLEELCNKYGITYASARSSISRRNKTIKTKDGRRIVIYKIQKEDNL